MENKNEINVKTNGDTMEVSIQGTPNELGPMIAQLATRLISSVTENMDDEFAKNAFADATIGSMLMSGELNIDIDDFCDTLKKAVAAKAAKSDKKEDVKKEIVKTLEGLKDLLKDLAQK